MNKFFVGAVVGAIAGAAAMFFFDKKKHEQDIAQVKEASAQYYMKQMQDILDTPPAKEEPKTPSKPANERRQYIAKAAEYIANAKAPEPKEEEVPCEFNDGSIHVFACGIPDRMAPTDYDEVHYTLFEDDILADDDYHPLTENDIRAQLGEVNVRKEMKYNADHTIAVVNDELRMVIYIDTDPRKWPEFVSTLPNYRRRQSAFDE